VTVQIHNEVTELVLEVERDDRQVALLQSQLTNQQQWVEVIEVSYRLGEGSTEQMMDLW
jgi:outer membrane protein TolC